MKQFLFITTFILSMGVFAHNNHHNHHHPHHPVACEDDPNCISGPIEEYTYENECLKRLIDYKVFINALNELLEANYDWPNHNDVVSVARNCRTVDQGLYPCKKLNEKDEPKLVKKSDEALQTCENFYEAIGF